MHMNVCAYQYYYWVILLLQKTHIKNTGSVCIKYGGYDLKVTYLYQVCNYQLAVVYLQIPLHYIICCRYIYVSVQSKFHIPSSIASLVMVIKQKANRNVCVDGILLFYTI